MGYYLFGGLGVKLFDILFWPGNRPKEYLKGFAPMPPAPLMSSAVVWRRSGFEAKWSGI